MQNVEQVSYDGGYAGRSLTIDSWPSILILTLKRFGYDEQARKIEKFIEFKGDMKVGDQDYVLYAGIDSLTKSSTIMGICLRGDIIRRMCVCWGDGNGLMIVRLGVWRRRLCLGSRRIDRPTCSSIGTWLRFSCLYINRYPMCLCV